MTKFAKTIKAALTGTALSISAIGASQANALDIIATGYIGNIENPNNVETDLSQGMPIQLTITGINIFQAPDFTAPNMEYAFYASPAETFKITIGENAEYDLDFISNHYITVYDHVQLSNSGNIYFGDEVSIDGSNDAGERAYITWFNYQQNPYGPEGDPTLTDTSLSNIEKIDSSLPDALGKQSGQTTIHLSDDLDIFAFWNQTILTETVPQSDGDFNLDQYVDEYDLEQWKEDFGSSEPFGAYPDGMADGADFLAWQRHYGEYYETPDLEANATPEPSALSMAFIAAAGGLMAGRIARHSDLKRSEQTFDL